MRDGVGLVGFAFFFYTLGPVVHGLIRPVIVAPLKGLPCLFWLPFLSHIVEFYIISFWLFLKRLNVNPFLVTFLLSLRSWRLSGETKFFILSALPLMR